MLGEGTSQTGSNARKHLKRTMAAKVSRLRYSPAGVTARVGRLVDGFSSKATSSN